ncbi:MAG: cytochrome P450 [Pseudomonadales bacterium]
MSESDTPPEQLSNRERQEAWRIDPRQDPADLPLGRLNPGHEALFEANTALPYFDRLRREAPVHLCEDSQYGPYWNVTRYDDIVYVDTHHDLFSSDIRLGGIRIGGRPLQSEPDPTTHLPMFIMEDPPEHDEHRKVLAPLFGPRNLAGLEDLIRERAGRILDGLPGDEEFNWVRRVSVELTGQMLASLFDVPQEDRHKLIHWSDTVERLGDPDYFESVREGFAELWKCWEYFDAVWKERASRAEPGPDLISLLAHGAATRDMAPNAYLGNVLLLIVGGNDTTRNSISASVLAQHRFPEEFAKLQADPALLPNLVSEVIRWQSPVAHMCRTATEDTQLGGHTIRKHDKVVMWYVSGNRDESVFPDADRVIADRPNARRHLSFGFGIHRCLGNRLGEMQLRVLWQEILKRFERIEVTDEPRYLRSSFIRGITELPVRVVPKA